MLTMHYIQMTEGQLQAFVYSLVIIWYHGILRNSLWFLEVLLNQSIEVLLC